MILKLKEVYRNRSLTRNKTPGQNWSTRSIFINAKHIVMIRENFEIKKVLKEGKVQGLKGNHDFCTISINGSDVVVVGSLEQLESKVRDSKREVLNG